MRPLPSKAICAGSSMSGSVEHGLHLEAGRQPEPLRLFLWPQGQHSGLLREIGLGRAAAAADAPSSGRIGRPTGDGTTLARRTAWYRCWGDGRGGIACRRLGQKRHGGRREGGGGDE